ncbi:MAG: hypothetical protein GYA17_18135 [Chloroflexi bacterium]|nr:hypothetical protein [Chloroflexota bacterium]
MTTPLDLKQIERRAYRSVYQDGLSDVFYGLVTVSMAVFLYRPPGGYRLSNLLLALGGYGLAYLLFWLGKKYITLPRMGQVKFGAARQKRRRTMTAVLGLVVFIQAIVVLFTALVWLLPDLGAAVGRLLGPREIMDLVVASVGALFVGVGMTLTAYFQDFPRGYYIGFLMMLAVFLMIFLNRPVYPLALGVLTLLPGLVLFVRFVQKYPPPGREHD